MRVETITYDASKGAWSLPDFPHALDSDRTLVVAFGAPELIEKPQPLKDLKAAFPRAKVVGCSSAGEIAGTSVRDHSLSVAVAKFDHTDLQVASLEVTSSAQSFTAGQSLAKQLARPGLRAVFVLSEGLDVNGSELVRGLNS
ncbi:MAG TPA: FIST N-terminal domain-containing protein, partial [Myxococcaceae bacterium]